MLQRPGPFLQFWRRSFGGHDLGTIYCSFYPVKKGGVSASGSGLYDVCLLAACHLSLSHIHRFHGLLTLIAWPVVVEFALN